MEAPLTDDYEVIHLFTFPSGQPFYRCYPCGVPIVSAEDVSRGTIPGSTVYYVQNMECVEFKDNKLPLQTSASLGNSNS